MRKLLRLYRQTSGLQALFSLAAAARPYTPPTEMRKTLAERLGFEPREGESPRRFSGPQQSSTLPSFLASAAGNYTHLTEIRKTLLFNATVIWLLVGLLAPAFAQDGHARYHQYYLNWKQPGQPTLSCCNARQIGPSGEDLTGDCEPTRAEIRNGQWFFWLRQESRWIQIEDDKLIRERNPSTEEGHLCAVKTLTATGWQWRVLCAVPPDTGG